MNTKLFTLFAMFFLVSFGANAATISAAGHYTSSGDLTNIPLGNIDLETRGLSSNVYYNSYTGTASENFAMLGITRGGIVENSGTTLYGDYAQPMGLNSGENYIATLAGGNAVFTLLDGVQSFSFLWGSIDGVNDVTVTNGNDDQYTISGTDILLSLGYNANDSAAIEDGMSAYFSVTDAAGIKSVVLRTGDSAFEAGRFAISSVPLPGALAFFGTGLVGLILRRKGLPV